ncbi:MAG: C1 family peptidase [Clostridia bacterium]|nr:C1 family peptidase [Clostridia bacterium]
MQASVTFEDLRTFEEKFTADRANRIAMDAVVNNGVLKSAKNAEAFRTTTHNYSITIQQGDITNQKASGRCWMFAALNCMRFEVMKKLNLKTFELSQCYTLFYDKLEKANYFLESILETLDEPTDGRLIAHLLSAPLNDGGQWDMLCNIVNKYGLVPKSAMPETVSSSATREMTMYMTEKLREYACVLRRMYKEGKDEAALREAKDAMVETMYNILCTCLGTPPTTFDLEVRDKDNNFIRETGLTPKTFYDKYIGMDLSEYVSIINAPTEDKPFYRSYTVKFLGNVKEGNIVRYVNLPVEELKAAAIAQMKDGQPVWFGCDVGKSSERDAGLMDLNLYHVGELFNTTFGMTKAERLDYGQSLMTHAMVFQGVNLDENGKPNRWRVENSWGNEPGAGGYYVMTDEWFDEYTYQIVVNKKYLSEDVLNAYNSTPIELEPWDPMGSLA